MLRDVQMVFHLCLDGAIVACSLLSLRGLGRWLFHVVSILVLFMVTWDFFALLVPAMAWEAAVAPAGVVLLFDTFCMLYLAACLYAQQSRQQTRDELDSLQRSKYNFAPA